MKFTKAMDSHIFTFTEILYRRELCAQRSIISYKL